MQRRERRDRERDGLRRRREQMEKEERDKGRERVRRRRGSSYYKWQILPWAYDKGFSILQGIEIPQ